MNDSLVNCLLLLILLLYTALVVAIGAGITQENCDNIWRDQLTNSGHAEYFLDESHKRQWRMKEIK